MLRGTNKNKCEPKAQQFIHDIIFQVTEALFNCAKQNFIK
jgi:hypothetical protein